MRFLFTCLFLAGCFCGRTQDTTRVLFIGNSFTYYHNMPWMVKSLADSAGIPVIVGMHAPGGISVGDTVQGNMAHMNNPVLFQLIRSQKWDFAVIQDNQGRFVRDSAVFPGSSKVVQGHLNIMDSVKKNNSCATIVLFAGWAFKNGSPPFGNTGVEMIERILRNYKVLNDTMKEVISPIGEAWMASHTQMPAVNLWDVDDAHSSYAGSYLTASVIFSTIFNAPAKPLNYDGNLPQTTALNLRTFGDSAVFEPAHHAEYNLGGIKHLSLSQANSQLSVPGNYSNYAWYKDSIYLGASSTIGLQGSGVYRAEVTESDGCIIKTCSYSALTTGLKEARFSTTLSVFPVPASGELFIDAPVSKIRLIGLTGAAVQLAPEKAGGLSRISLDGIEPGCYLLELVMQDRIVHKKIVVSAKN